MNVPKLRFPEFYGELKRVNLGKITKFSKGKGISKSDIDENGHIECIRYGELYTYYSELINDIKSKTKLLSEDLVLSEINDVIIPASGETQIDIATASCIIKSGVALGGDLNILKTPLNGIFLAYYLNNKKKLKIARLSQGISVVHLYSNQLKQLVINFPILYEQKKIADFLSAVDKKIQLLTRKKELLEQYKKGVMQKIFSQEIRFKDENGKDFPDWEEKKLCEFLNERIEYSEEQLPLYSLTIEEGVIPKSKRYERSFLVKQLDNAYKVMKMNDFAFNPMNLRFGALARFKENKRIFVSRYYNIFLCNKNGNPEYFEYFLKSYNMIQFYEKMSTGSLIEKKRVHYLDFINFKLKIPCYLEQKKIASFLSELDKKINYVENQINKTKEFKKGLLQQMFV